MITVGALTGDSCKANNPAEGVAGTDLLQITNFHGGRSGTDIERVHVLSMGRQGSCFMEQWLAADGDDHYRIMEPLKGRVEGADILAVSKATTDQRLHCLYDCRACLGFPPLVNIASTKLLLEYCASLAFSTAPHPYMVIKTTRIVDHRRLVQGVPQELLKPSRFVVLLRDPRAIWASTKPFTGWAIHHKPLICQLAALQALSIPDLVAGVGQKRVMVGFFEKWTWNTTAFAIDIATFLGQDQHKYLAKAKEGQRPLSKLMPPSWVSHLAPEEVSQLDNDENCAVLMSRVGYKPNSTDYSQLKSLSELAATLTNPEEQVLIRLRAMQAALLQEAPSLDAEEDDGMKFVFEGPSSKV